MQLIALQCHAKYAKEAIRHRAITVGAAVPKTTTSPLCKM